MKYHFKLSDAEKSFVAWQLVDYPKDKRTLEDLQNGGAKAGLMRISTPYIQRITLGVEAIEKAFSRFDATDMQLIELLYWKKGYTVEEAGKAVYLQRSAAYNRLNIILGSIAYEMGLMKGA